MKFRLDLAKAIINELIDAMDDGELSVNGVYLVEADDDAEEPYLVYKQITDGEKNYAFDESSAVTSQPVVQINLWDGSSPASGTSEEILDELDDVLDQTKIDRSDLEFTCFNTGSMDRDYQSDSGLWRSWIRYSLQTRGV